MGKRTFVKFQSRNAVGVLRRAGLSAGRPCGHHPGLGCIVFGTRDLKGGGRTERKGRRREQWEGEKRKRMVKRRKDIFENSAEIEKEGQYPKTVREKKEGSARHNKKKGRARQKRHKLGGTSVPK